MNKKRKEVRLEPEVISRLQKQANLYGLELKPYMEMRLVRISHENSDLIGNWQAQPEVTEQTLKIKS